MKKRELLFNLGVMIAETHSDLKVFINKQNGYGSYLNWLIVSNGEGTVSIELGYFNCYDISINYISSYQKGGTGAEYAKGLHSDSVLSEIKQAFQMSRYSWVLNDSSTLSTLAHKPLNKHDLDRYEQIMANSTFKELEGKKDAK